MDNHDNVRFLNVTPDAVKLRSAIAFALSTVGIPIIYYGDE